jgi:hypothetical protein
MMMPNRVLNSLCAAADANLANKALILFRRIPGALTVFNEGDVYRYFHDENEIDRKTAIRLIEEDY